MKTTTMLVLAAGFLVACNNDTTTAEKKEGDKEVKVAGMSTEEKVDLPYTVQSNGDWKTGSRQNLKMVLESMKNWEKKDFDASVKDFADSVELRFDGFEKKVSKQGAKETISAQRNAYRDVQIIMDDFESVQSPDGKQQYVSVWYKQKWQDMGLKWDSLSVMDDIKIINGKIASIDEKTRHYAKK